MAIEITIQLISYPRISAIAVRDGIDEVSIAADYMAGGTSAKERRDDLELQLMRRAKSAFDDFDAESARRDNNASIQSDVMSLKRNITVPPIPSTPSIIFTEAAGKLRIHGVVGVEVVSVVLLIDGVFDDQIVPTGATYSFEKDVPSVDTSYTVRFSNVLDETAEITDTFVV